MKLWVGLGRGVGYVEGRGIGVGAVVLKLRRVIHSPIGICVLTEVRGASDLSPIREDKKAKKSP